MTKITQDRHLLKLDTPLEKDKLVLTSLEGTEAISSLFSFSLQAFSSDFSISEKSILGLIVTCQINDKNNPPRFINGYVSQFRAKHPWLTKVREYNLEIVPWLWFLTLSTDCQIFQNKNVIEICETIFKQFGFADYEILITNTYEKREYCVQYNESTFHFISRLLEEEGIFYFFKHEKKKHVLVLGDLISKCPYNPNKEVTFSQGSLVPHHITQWEHAYNFCSGEFIQTDYNYTKPTIDLLTSTKTLIDLPNIKKYTVFKFPGGYQEKSRGNQLSRIRIEEQEQQYTFIEGRSNLCQFCVGTLFTLISPELGSEKGPYCLIAVTHRVKDETHKIYSIQRETTVYENQFTCVPASLAYRPQSLTPKPRIQGLQIALVVGPAHEEIYTDQYGRIKVQFLWDRLGKKNETSSCWLRVAQSWAGQKWGTLYIPRVGQEVIVDFLEGDPDLPVVIGSLYNAQNMPPYDLPSNQTQSGIKSRSTPKADFTNCNEIRLEDKKGSEQFFVHAQKDFQRIVENDDCLKVMGKQEINIKKDRLQVVEEGNDVIEVKKGNQTITLDSGNQTIQLSQGNRNTKIDIGNDSLHIQQGDHTIKVDIGKSSIEAMQGISLTVGGNSIKIDQTGITLQGIMVKVNGKLIQCQADAVMQVKGSLVMIN